MNRASDSFAELIAMSRRTVMKLFSLGLFLSILSSVSSATASGAAIPFRKSSESFLIVLRFPAGCTPEKRLISLREGLLPSVKGWVPFLD